MGPVSRMTSITHLLLFSLLGSLAAEATSRQPKLFFVSSTSTTSTVSTTTLCYRSSKVAITSACSRRKRRMVKDNLVATDAIKATKLEDGVTSSLDEDKNFVEVAGEEERKGKFLLYWMTTTSTSTTTTYTSTTTLHSISCTPSGFTISNCSG